MILNQSLQNRLMFMVLMTLIIFLGVTGLALENAFKQKVAVSTEQKLEVIIYSLLSAAEMTEGQLVMPTELPDVRLNTPGSNLYAQITVNGTEQLWYSGSLLGKSLQLPNTVQTGKFSKHFMTDEADEKYVVLTYGLVWETVQGDEFQYSISVAESDHSGKAEIAAFRKHLWAWLLGAAFALLIIQLMIFRWVIQPLRKVADELGELESGQRKEFSLDYPKELAGLIENLNAFVLQERNQRERFKNRLADMAHSLKTPIAVMKNEIKKENDQQRKVRLAESIGKIDQVVSYQLQRASTTGRSVIGHACDPSPIIRSLSDAMQKVYADKSVECELTLHAGPLKADQGDLYECFGNLMDNAFKYCHSKVKITTRDEHNTQLGDYLLLSIEDDGAGIPETYARDILQRGIRLDETREGQGIGLAVVKEIVDLYGGELNFSVSVWGGTKVDLKISSRHNPSGNR